MSTNDKLGEDRLKKESGAAVRGSRDNADADRVTQDGTALTAAQRRKLLREEWVQTVLPTPPELPGFHLCWISLTNSTDPIHKRLQIGYTPVRITEVPGFEQYLVSEGQYEGCVACNEMLLFKLPIQVYQDLMAIYHHDMPLEQEQAIRDRVESEQKRDSTGKQLTTVEGDFVNLGQRPAQEPHFAN